MAYAARAATPTGAGMVVIPDVRGLHPYYKELADRFAEVGVDAVAIDFFARTAPSDDRSDSFDFMAQVPQTKPDTLQADIAAGGGLPARQGRRRGAFALLGRLLLRRRALVPPGGERARLRGRDRVLRLAARAQAAGRIGRSRSTRSARYKCSVLSLFGGADRGHPAEPTSTSSTPRASKAGVKHDSTVYPGAPHSFFDRKQTEFAEASADAWKRVQAFVRQNTKA